MTMHQGKGKLKGPAMNGGRALPGGKQQARTQLFKVARAGGDDDDGEDDEDDDEEVGSLHGPVHLDTHPGNAQTGGLSALVGSVLQETMWSFALDTTAPLMPPHWTPYGSSGRLTTERSDSTDDLHLWPALRRWRPWRARWRPRLQSSCGRARPLRAKRSKRRLRRRKRMMSMRMM